MSPALGAMGRAVTVRVTVTSLPCDAVTSPNYYCLDAPRLLLPTLLIVQKWRPQHRDRCSQHQWIDTPPGHLISKPRPRTSSKPACSCTKRLQRSAQQTDRYCSGIIIFSFYCETSSKGSLLGMYRRTPVSRGSSFGRCRASVYWV